MSLSKTNINSKIILREAQKDRGVQKVASYKRLRNCVSVLPLVIRLDLNNADYSAIAEWGGGVGRDRVKC